MWILLLSFFATAQASTQIEFPLFAKRSLQVYSIPVFAAQTNLHLDVPEVFTVHDGEDPDEAEARFQNLADKVERLGRVQPDFRGFELTLGDQPLAYESLASSATCYRGEASGVLNTIQVLWGQRFDTHNFLWGVRYGQKSWLDSFVTQNSAYSEKWLPQEWWNFSTSARGVLLVGSHGTAYQNAFAWYIPHCK